MISSHENLIPTNSEQKKPGPLKTKRQLSKQKQENIYKKHN